MFKLEKSLSDSNQLIDYVSSNDYYRTKNFIENRNYTSKELNSIEDSYMNNLLHLAVMSSSSGLVSYLLDKNISCTKQNKFKQSPWDLAVHYNNKEIVENFVAHRSKIENQNSPKVLELTRENSSLKKENNSLKTLNTQFLINNENLETRYSLRNRDVLILQNENTDLKVSNKRLREEVTEVTNQNKKLKEENNLLSDKNKKLQLSVETLMYNSKK